MPSLKPYPAYADTDLPWLPKIPKHWEVQRAKFIFKKMSRPVREEDDVVTAFRDGTVTLRTNRRTEGFTFSIKEIGYQGIRKGDLVIHQMDGFAGAIGVSDSDGKSTPIYSVCVPLIPASTYFYAYLLRQMAKSDFILSLAKGIRERSSDFRFDVFKELELPIPPLEEQQAIAAYLDRQTAKIDALIAKKQRLLDLLAEQRAALISQAVTKGLNPTAKMKDSGVAWLGQVPSHWEVSKLGYVSASIQTGPFGSQIHSNEYVTGGIPLINPAHIKDGKIYPSEDVAVDQKTWHTLSRHELLEGDIIFARRGEMGRCALVTEIESGWLCGTGSIRLRLKKPEIFPKYLSWVLSTKGISDYLLLESVGTTMDNLNTKILATIPLSVPPIKEQVEISEYLDYQTKRLSNLAAKVDNAIERLQEYRAALISSVVTGKVDVRKGDIL